MVIGRQRSIAINVTALVVRRDNHYRGAGPVSRIVGFSGHVDPLQISELGEAPELTAGDGYRPAVLGRVCAGRACAYWRRVLAFGAAHHSSVGQPDKRVRHDPTAERAEPKVAPLNRHVIAHGLNPQCRDRSR